MRKHVCENHPRMLCIPQYILRKKKVFDDPVKKPIMMVRTTGKIDHQLYYDNGKEDRHIDNDEAGNRITCLELVSDVVSDGSKHYLKCMSYPLTFDPQSKLDR